MLIVGLVPMFILGLAFLRLQRDGLGHVERELEAAVVDEASSNVRDVFHGAAELATITATTLADDTRDADARIRDLRTELARLPQVSSIAFFDDERHFIDAIVADNAPTEIPPPEGEGFRIIGSPDDPIFRFEHKIAEGPVRFVVVTVPSSSLGTRLTELSLTRFGSAGDVYVVNDSKRVVVGKIERRDRRPPIFDVTEYPAAAFSSPMLMTSEFVDNGVSKVGTIRTLPAWRLAVVVERPTDEAFASLAKTRRAFMWTLGGFATISVIAGLIVTRRALGPISRLIRLVGRYSQRDFAARSEVHTHDELEALGGSLEQMADELSASEFELRRRAKIEADLARFLPSEVAQSVASGRGSLELGGERKRITVIFADVVAFTTFAERTSPEHAVAFLNELFTILSEIVFRHGGMVDKFIGDCIMAIFVDSKDAGGNQVARALMAAEDMHRFVESNLPRWQKEYDFAARLAVGVATGEALVGNLGSEARMEYTAIGDVVNVAARLESLASAQRTLATAEVAAACPDVEFTSLGKHALRGRVEPIEVFEVMS
ncbi:MAG: HAMP domain-containing protein [Polyangiaceae bacterium]|nr:HAMP domain-containing protein [Polyangiaceae bacterium]